MIEDLLGKIPENEIVKIAWREAEKRRVAEEELARKYGKQRRLDGAVPVCRGYAIYKDFEEYIKQIVVQERLKLFGWDLSKVKSKIRKTLVAARWTVNKVNGEIRFYPPRVRGWRYNKSSAKGTG